MAIELNDIEQFCPDSTSSWREWLQTNHTDKQSVWLVYYKKNSGMPSINWSEAVDQAVCFGWIDSIGKPLDERRYMQLFSRMRESTWSKINKQKIIALTEAGLITVAGLDCITVAKENGSWQLLDKVEELILPEDLIALFNDQPEGKTFFLALSKSVRKAMLQWVVLAKRPETRQKRINEIVRFAVEQIVPKQFRP